jgi:hypothetical protein
MLFNRARFLTALFTALCLLALAISCSRGGDEEDDAGGGGGETALTPYTPTGKEGTIKGTIVFAGQPPTLDPIPMDADANCLRANPEGKDEALIVNGDKLQYVFVYIKEGKLTDGGKNINTLSFGGPPGPVTLHQEGCMYRPRVIGMQTRQKLLVTNDDQTTHNVNVASKKNEGINPSQPPGTPAIEHEFKQSEILVPVKCNQHPWMIAYIGVLRHSFFDRSKEDGSFEIKDLPPGTYTLVAWHEKYAKEQTQQITVGSGETKTDVKFTFDSGNLKASNELDGGSLTVMPALEIPLLVGRKHH